MAAYLTPPSTGKRPLPKRLHSLQTPTTRPSPYPASPSATPSRPDGPRRSHSFCGDSSTQTFALASASTSSYLAIDKQNLIAPPLERTLSSIGVRGNQVGEEGRMNRPLNMPCQEETSLPTPPLSPVPQIYVQSSTPPRPSSTRQSSSASFPTPSTPLTGPVFGKINNVDDVFSKDKDTVVDMDIDQVAESLEEISVA